MRRVAVPLVLALLLAGCSGEQTDHPAEQGDADAGVTEDTDRPPEEGPSGTEIGTVGGGEGPPPAPPRQDPPSENRTLPTVLDVDDDGAFVVHFESHPDGGVASFPFTVPARLDGAGVQVQYQLVAGNVTSFGLEVYRIDAGLVPLARATSAPAWTGPGHDDVDLAAGSDAGTTHAALWKTGESMRLVMHAFAPEPGPVEVAMRFTTATIGDLSLDNATTYGPDATAVGYHLGYAGEYTHAGTHTVYWSDNVDVDWRPGELHGVGGAWDGTVTVSVDVPWTTDVGWGGAFVAAEGGAGTWTLSADVLGRQAEGGGDHASVSGVGAQGSLMESLYHAGSGGLSMTFTWTGQGMEDDMDLTILTIAYGGDPEEILGHPGWDTWTM